MPLVGDVGLSAVHSESVAEIRFVCGKYAAANHSEVRKLYDTDCVGYMAGKVYTQGEKTQVLSQSNFTSQALLSRLQNTTSSNGDVG